MSYILRTALIGGLCLGIGYLIASYFTKRHERSSATQDIAKVLRHTTDWTNRALKAAVPSKKHSQLRSVAETISNKHIRHTSPALRMFQSAVGIESSSSFPDDELYKHYIAESTQKPKKVSEEMLPSITSLPDEGNVYLDSTAPYGPPHNMKKSLFNEFSSKDISIKDNQQQPMSAPSVSLPRMPAYSQHYGVQAGSFSSRIYAERLADKLQQKGYNVGIYQEQNKLKRPIYAVRLTSLFEHDDALHTAHTLTEKDNILAMVIEEFDNENRIR